MERLLRRDRFIVGCGLAALTALSWFYLVNMAGSMRLAAGEAEMHRAMGMPEMGAWGPAQLVALFLMWTVMMVGMMVPSAAPMMLLVLGVYRRRGHRARVSAAAFILGYLVAWVAFSEIAAAAQFVLHQTALLSPEMAARSRVLAGAILIAAGVYQWLPIKNSCLAHCRSPLATLAHEWREGAGGALVMGMRHGMFCVGCCWALMGLLFVVGVMNLLWVAIIAAFVFVEKLAAQGARLGRLAGVLLVLWGVYVLAA